MNSTYSQLATLLISIPSLNHTETCWKRTINKLLWVNQNVSSLWLTNMEYARTMEHQVYKDQEYYPD